MAALASLLVPLYTMGAAMSDPNRPLSEGKITALKLLKQALDDAEDAGQNIWQFAIRKANLLRSGATVNDLRWLLSRHLIDQAGELTKRGDDQRSFFKITGLHLPDDACFILSHGGKVYVERNGLEAPVLRDKGDDVASLSRIAPCSSPTPEWRHIEGELCFRGEVVRRRGRKAARLEETLLAQFAKANWASSIANPFRGPRARRRARLIETVRRLNESLLGCTLRFHARNNGEVALWEDCAFGAE